MIRRTAWLGCALLVAGLARAEDPAPTPAATTPAAPAAAVPAAPAATPPAANTPSATPPKTPEVFTVVSTPARDVGQLAWMHGCWSGKVNKRSFTEQWTAPAAGLMLGLGHTVLGEKTESFEFMRIETLPDARIVFVLRPAGKEEDPYLFMGVKSERDVDFFIFSNPKREFPSRIIYSHSQNGRLFVHVQGKVNGADREVVYPYVQVNCATGKPV